MTDQAVDVNGGPAPMDPPPPDPPRRRRSTTARAAPDVPSTPPAGGTAARRKKPARRAPDSPPTTESEARTPDPPAPRPAARPRRTAARKTAADAPASGARKKSSPRGSRTAADGGSETDAPVTAPLASGGRKKSASRASGGGAEADARRATGARRAGGGSGKSGGARKAEAHAAARVVTGRASATVALGDAGGADASAPADGAGEAPEQVDAHVAPPPETSPPDTPRPLVPPAPRPRRPRPAPQNPDPDPDPGFFGRQRELKALHSDIERAGLNTIAGRRDAHTRVLLIAGQRGAGRTALARELARQVGRRYPDGVLHIRLTEPGGEPVPVERTARDLLGRFGIDVPPGAGEDELSDMVREALAVRRVLLLLDDAHDAEQVDLLLPENPDCLVIAVACGPLTGIPDVRPCTIGGLDAKSAIELLGAFTGSVRITVDPQAAESLAEECGGQPTALALVGGWLAANPMISVADVAKRLRSLPGDPEQPQGARALARAFRFVYEGLPHSTAGMLRLLSLAPAGLADAHTASALAGCSVSAAGAALDDLAALNLLRPAGGQYEIPGSLAPMMRALMDAKDRPAEVQLARARMLERTVRLLQSCRAVTEPDGSPARKKLAALPRAVRFPTAPAAADWLASRRPALLASARLAVADGALDTLARRLVSALVRALAAHQGTDAAAPDLYGLHQLVLGVAERQGLHREEGAALLNIGDLDARSGRTYDALARYRSALDAGRAANDHYATGRAMESVGGAYQELQDWHRAADWYGRALAQRLSREERADEARLYGRLGTVHTHAGSYVEALRHWRAAAAGHRRLQDLPGQARALIEVARVQEYAGRPEESLHTCQEAVELARLAGDPHLQAALELRLADTLDRLGDPTAARLHRNASDRLLGTDPSAYEIRSTSAEG